MNLARQSPRVLLKARSVIFATLDVFCPKTSFSSTAESSASDSCTEIQVSNKMYSVDHMTNVTPAVLDLMERKLHVTANHPINMVKQKIYDYFQKNFTDKFGSPLFTTFDDISPVTTPAQNFDSLLIPEGHKDRSKIENFYINEHTLLRCHTTAHASDMIAMGYDRFLCTGDVYRRDEYTDAHSPVFHQMDIQQLCTREELFPNSSCDIFEDRARISKDLVLEGKRQCVHTMEAATTVMSNMKKILEDVVIGECFGHNIKYRWKDYYCQMGCPVREMEVMVDDEWLEILAAGILHQEILDKAGAVDKIGWSCGLGLDRIAMILYGIPDIRLLRSKNDKFLSQFNKNSKSCSECPSYTRGMCFWLPHNAVSAAFEYDFYEFVRIVAEDDIQKVELIDQFQDPKTGRVSHRYRFIYKNWEIFLSEGEVNEQHKMIRELAASKLKVLLQ